MDFTQFTIRSKNITEKQVKNSANDFPVVIVARAAMNENKRTKERQTTATISKVFFTLLFIKSSNEFIFLRKMSEDLPY
mgnify:CR=1 FL=1